MQKLWLATFLISTACGGAEPIQVVTRDSAGIQIVVSGVPASTQRLGEPTFRLGAVDGGPAEFHRIRDVRRLVSGDLLVANAGSDELRVFSTDGTFLRTIGRRGGGPGELNGLRSAKLMADSIVTYDNRNDRISVFTSDGAFSRSFRLEWSGGLLGPELVVPGVGVLSTGGTHMVDLKLDGVNTDTVTVSLHDLDGSLVRNLTRLPHNQRFVRRRGDRQTTLGAPLTTFASFSGTSDGFCYVYGPTADVQCFNWNGELQRVLRLNEPPRRVTAEDVAAYEEEFLGRSDIDRPEIRSMLLEMPHPEFLPAFDKLLSRAGGQLWARRYQARSRDAEHWVIFGPAGTVVATVSGPEGAEFFHVSEDEVLARSLDALDVEYVVAFAVQPG